LHDRLAAPQLHELLAILDHALELLDRDLLALAGLLRAVPRKHALLQLVRCCERRAGRFAFERDVPLLRGRARIASRRRERWQRKREHERDDEQTLHFGLPFFAFLALGKFSMYSSGQSSPSKGQYSSSSARKPWTRSGSRSSPGRRPADSASICS